MLSSPSRAVVRAFAIAALVLAVAAPAQACTGSGCYTSVAAFGKDPAFANSVFRFPQAIAFSPGGAYVFVADQYSGIVQKFDYQGNYQNWWVGGFADQGQLRRLGTIGGLATDRAGHLFVLDSQNDRVQVFGSDTGQWLASWGSHGIAPGAFDLGANTGAGGIAVFQATAADAPIVYIADQYNDRIQRFALTQPSSADPSGGPVLPPGDRGSLDATLDAYNAVTAPTPDRTWGAYGSCGSAGTCSSTAYDYALYNPQGVTVNPVGRHDVYVADDDNHRVVEYTPDGTYVNQVGTFGTGSGQFKYPYDVGVDGTTSDGTATGAPANRLSVADNNNHRLQQFDAVSLGFIGMWGVFGSGTGDFEYPRALGALAEDPRGGTYVADTANNRIQGWYQKAGGAPTYVFGTAGRGPGYVTRPFGLTFDAAGNAYVADTYDSRIEKLSSTGAYLDQFGYISSNSGFAAPGSGDGEYDNPRDVAYDPKTGHLWVADTKNNRVQEIATSGSWIATYTGFSSPSGVAVDANGVVYVADTGNHRVQRFSGGSWSTVAGTTFDQPRDVAVDDATGALYVSDFSTNQVQRLLGGAWSSVGSGFANPAGLAVDRAHRFLYVADSGNDQVKRLDLSSGAWDAWGSYGYDAGAFVAPSGLAVAPGGDLVVADTYANRLQRFSFGFPPAIFTLSANPSALTVRRGASGSSTITITPSGGFDSAVSLSVASCPRSVSCSFAPNPATSSSTLTVKVGRKASAGTTTLDVVGTGAGVTGHTSVALTVG